MRWDSQRGVVLKVAVKYDTCGLGSSVAVAYDCGLGGGIPDPAVHYTVCIMTPKKGLGTWSRDLSVLARAETPNPLPPCLHPNNNISLLGIQTPH